MSDLAKNHSEIPSMAVPPNQPKTWSSCFGEALEVLAAPSARGRDEMSFPQRHQPRRKRAKTTQSSGETHGPWFSKRSDCCDEMIFHTTLPLNPPVVHWACFLRIPLGDQRGAAKGWSMFEGERLSRIPIGVRRLYAS